MFEWLNPHSCPVGVDVTSTGVWLARLESTRTPHAAVATAANRPVTFSRDAGSDEKMACWADAIRRAWELGDFGRVHAVVALPDPIVETRTIRLPMHLAQNAGISPESIPELRDSFPFDVSEAALRVHVAGTVSTSSGDEAEWIVAAARMADVKMWLKHLRQVGVRVSSLQLRAQALYAGLLRHFAASNEADNSSSTLACLQVEAARSRVIIGRDQHLTFVKDIPVGLDHLDQAIARKVAVVPDEAARLRQRWSSQPASGESLRDPVRQAVYDAARGPLEELASQVALCLRYHAIMFRGNGPRGLMLATHASDHDLLKSTLGTSIPLPIDARPDFEPVDSRKMKPADRAAGWAVWASATGLSAWSTSAVERVHAAAA